MGLQAPSRHGESGCCQDAPRCPPPPPPLPASQQLTQHCCTEVGFAPMQHIDRRTRNGTNEHSTCSMC